MVLSERTLDEGPSHLLCADKISGFRIWLIEIWTSANIGRVSITDTEEQK